ncbi:MAG TPA: homoserine dehydrogenase, partial [Bacteroidota bacterium]|nr:homoserine dehydrogenase [Bacteroidota bacterium]
VEGIDATFKLCLILFHAFGVIADPHSILRKGISSLHPFDMQYAREKGKRVKLLARANRVNGSQYSATVLPGFVDHSSKLFDVHNEYNGLLIGSSLADEQFLSGKGAGRYPTASAVLSDISALRYGYKYEYRKHSHGVDLSSHDKTTVELYLSYPAQKIIDESVFSQVHESYRGTDRGYLTGSITIGHIRESAWLNDNAVSVITLN